MKPAFVFVADTHLDSLTYQNMTDMREDSFVAFEHAVTLAIKKKVDLVVAGDFVECNPREYPRVTTIAFLAAQLDRLEAAKLKCYFVYGQHDRTTFNTRMYDVGYPSAINPKVAIPLDSMRVNIGGIDVVGIHSQFQHDLVDAFQNAASLHTENCVLLCHQRWKELLKFDGAEEGSLRDIPDCFDFVITGDLHAVKILRMKLPNSRNRTILSPGATARRSKREGDKFYAWVMYQDRVFKRRLLPSRPTMSIEINTLEDVDYYVDNKSTILKKLSAKSEKVPPRIAKPLLYISGSAPTEYFRAVIDTYQPFCHIKDSERSSGNTEKLHEAAVRGEEFRGKISAEALVGNVTQDEEIISFVKQGLRASDKSSFVETWRAQRGL